MHCDEKDLTETVLVVIIFLTFLSETIQERKNCPVSAVFRHVRSAQKEQINNHNGLLLKMRSLYVSTRFVSSGVTCSCALASRSSTFPDTLRNHVNISILVHELCVLHVTAIRCRRRRQCTRHPVLFLQSLPRNVACFSRLRLAMPFMIDLHNFCLFLSLLSSPIDQDVLQYATLDLFCCAPVVCDCSFIETKIYSYRYTWMTLKWMERGRIWLPCGRN